MTTSNLSAAVLQKGFFFFFSPWRFPKDSHWQHLIVIWAQRDHGRMIAWWSSVLQERLQQWRWRKMLLQVRPYFSIVNSWKIPRSAKWFLFIPYMPMQEQVSKECTFVKKYHKPLLILIILIPQKCSWQLQEKSVQFHHWIRLCCLYCTFNTLKFLQQLLMAYESSTLRINIFTTAKAGRRSVSLSCNELCLFFQNCRTNISKSE